MTVFKGEQNLRVSNLEVIDNITLGNANINQNLFINGSNLALLFDNSSTTGNLNVETINVQNITVGSLRSNFLFNSSLISTANLAVANMTVGRLIINTGITTTNLFIGGNTQQNFIQFGGTNLDVSSTFIGERIHTGTEGSELLLFKGNETTGGPDRIRLLAAEHRFETYTGASLSGNFAGVATSGITRMVITTTGNVGINNTAPTTTIDVSGTARITTSITTPSVCITQPLSLGSNKNDHYILFDRTAGSSLVINTTPTSPNLFFLSNTSGAIFTSYSSGNRWDVSSGTSPLFRTPVPGLYELNFSCDLENYTAATLNCDLFDVSNNVQRGLRQSIDINRQKTINVNTLFTSGNHTNNYCLRLWTNSGTTGCTQFQFSLRCLEKYI